MNLNIKTLYGVNVRLGPDTTFEVIDNVDAGKILKATEFKKDGAGTGWYKVDTDKWICARFVTTEVTKSDINKAMGRTTNTVLKMARSPMALNATTREGEATTDTGFKETTADSSKKVMSATEQTLKDIENSIIGSAVDINSGLFGSLASGIIGTDTGAAPDSVILNQRIFGTPFQFLDTTDIRPSGCALGIFFQSSIMGEAPILSILPGRPDYLADLDDESKQNLIQSLASQVSDANNKVNGWVQDMLHEKQFDTKYFEFLPQYSMYIRYVNILCRLGAIYLGLDGTQNDGDSNPDVVMNKAQVPGSGKLYKYYDWSLYTLSNTYALKAVNDTEGLEAIANDLKNTDFEASFFETKEGKDSVFETTVKKGAVHLTSYDMQKYYVDFYINPSMSYSESFTNQTTESALAGALSKASGFQKEFLFLLEAAGYDASTSLKDLNKELDAAKGDISSTLGSGGASKIMNRLLGGMQSVITGSNIVFPEVWQSSSFERNYSFEIKLCTPYGDKESIYLEIMVPLFHLLALVLPTQATVNTYSSPFIVRTILPGFFASEMGIISDLTINKGGSGDSWTADGLPTEVTVNITIRDLYNSLSMSKFDTPKDIYNFVWNSALMDFIGVQCGVNMKKSEMNKKLEILQTFAENWMPDLESSMLDTIKESSSQSILKILGGRN